MLNTALVVDGNGIASKAYGVASYKRKKGEADPEFARYYIEEEQRAYRTFFTMLVPVIMFYNPSHLFLVFDDPTIPNPRNVNYPDAGYKAQRVSDPARTHYLKFLVEYLERMQVPLIRHGEADDMIASLVDKFAPAIIYSKDADMCALIDDDRGIAVIDHVYDEVQLKKFIYKDEAWCTENMGVPPDLVLDLKTLQGDSSDNIKGIPGIGGKSALKLLNAYGDVGSVFSELEAADENDLPTGITKRMRNAVIKNRESGRLAWNLVSFYPPEIDHINSDDYLCPGEELFRSLGEAMEVPEYVEPID